MDRQQRVRVRRGGYWVVFCACLAGLLGALGQTCGPDYISWPREQCTQVCLGAGCVSMLMLLRCRKSDAISRAVPVWLRGIIA